MRGHLVIMTEHNMALMVGTQKELHGWVRYGDCNNPACKKAMRRGLMWHATPAGFGEQLPAYHFATQEEAKQALLKLPVRA